RSERPKSVSSSSLFAYSLAQASGPSVMNARKAVTCRSVTAKEGVLVNFFPGRRVGGSVTSVACPLQSVPWRGRRRVHRRCSEPRRPAPPRAEFEFRRRFRHPDFPSTLSPGRREPSFLLPLDQGRPLNPGGSLAGAR